MKGIYHEVINRKRLLAGAIDFGIAFLLAFFISFAANGFKKEIEEIGIFLLLCILLGLFVLFKDVTLIKRSVGKKIMKLCIVPTDCRKIGRGKLILRNLLLVLFPLELYFLEHEEPRLGDRITNTTVVAEEKADSWL